MVQTTAQSFACPQCAKRFTWKPEFADRKIACACGKVFDIEVGLDRKAAGGQIYNIGTEKVMGIPTSQEPKHGVAAAYPRRTKRNTQLTAAELDPETAQPIKHIYFPWFVLLIGMGIRIAQVFYATQTSMRGAAVLVILDIHLNAAVMLGGAYLAASLLGADFGSLPRASIKLAAIAIFSDAVASWMIALGHRTIPAFVAAIHLVLLLYLILFYAMFDLDVQESLVTVVIVWVLQGIAQVAIFSLITP